MSNKGAHEKIKAIILEVQQDNNISDCIISSAHLMWELQCQKIKSFSKKRMEARNALRRDLYQKNLVASIIRRCIHEDPRKNAEQYLKILKLYGVPHTCSFRNRVNLKILEYLSAKFPSAFNSLHYLLLHKYISPFRRHISPPREYKRGVLRLSNSPVGDGEIKANLNRLYLDLANGSGYVIFPVSQIFTGDHPSNYEKELLWLTDNIMESLRSLGTGRSALVLHVDKYSHLNFAKDLLLNMLCSFDQNCLSLGLSLPADFPDSYLIQREVVERSTQLGRPLYIRIYRGVNSWREIQRASGMGVPQPQYKKSAHVLANMYRMLEHAISVDVVSPIIASVDPLDIAYGLIIDRGRRRLAWEGMPEIVTPLCEDLTDLFSDINFTWLVPDGLSPTKNLVEFLLFVDRSECGIPPSVADKKEVVNIWSECVVESLQCYKGLSSNPRYMQNRSQPPCVIDPSVQFETNQITDLSIATNREWGKLVLSTWEKKHGGCIPLIINKEKVFTNEKFVKNGFVFSMGGVESIGQALDISLEEQTCMERDVSNRVNVLSKVSNLVEADRGGLIGALAMFTGRSFVAADREVSMVVDLSEHYIRSVRQMAAYSDIQWDPKGPIVVSSSWGLPLASVACGALAAFAVGNSVIISPKKEHAFIAYMFADLMSKAGYSPQFIPCEDFNLMLQSNKISGAVEVDGHVPLRFNANPSIIYHSPSKGNNVIIVTSFAEINIAVNAIVNSAFVCNGELHNAVSLVILDRYVYERSDFINKLKDATKSLSVGSPWEISSAITQLHTPCDRILEYVTLLEGEEWILEPMLTQLDGETLCTPGIKLVGFVSKRSPFAGPILEVVVAKGFDDALRISNSIPRGYSSGIISMDHDEHRKWLQTRTSSLCSINLEISGKKSGRVRPFGTTFSTGVGSCFVSGGLNYLAQFASPKQVKLPREKFAICNEVNNLTKILDRFSPSAEALGTWYSSISSYAYFWKQISRAKDRSKIIGEDHFSKFVTRKKILFRVALKDTPLNFLRVFAAALTAKVRLDVSWDIRKDFRLLESMWDEFLPLFPIIKEDEASLINRIEVQSIKFIRTLQKPSIGMLQASSKFLSHIEYSLPLANGRFELPKYLREVFISSTYHADGFLGLREEELRAPVK